MYEDRLFNEIKSYLNRSRILFNDFNYNDKFGYIGVIYFRGRNGFVYRLVIKKEIEDNFGRYHLMNFKIRWSSYIGKKKYRRLGAGKIINRGKISRSEILLNIKKNI